MSTTLADTPVSEDQLRLMARSVKKSMPKDTHDSEAINKLNTLVDSLFITASFPELLSSHRVASWNVLCAYMEQCSILFDNHADLQHSKLVRDLWLRGFDLYLNYASLARPKSSRQLLVTLTTLLRRQVESGTDAVPVILNAVTDYLRLFVQDGDHAQAKTYAAALAQFLSRDLLDLRLLRDRLVLHLSAIQQPPDPAVDPLSNFLVVLFERMRESDLASSFGTLVSILLDKWHRSQDPPTSTSAEAGPVWLQPLLQFADSAAFDPDTLRSHLLPILFKRDVADYATFLASIGLNGTTSVALGSNTKSRELIFISLQAGKEAGLLRESSEHHMRLTEDVVLLPMIAIAGFLAEASRSARLTGLFLLISSPSATRPFIPATFTLLKHHLPHSFADTDANYRSEVFSLTQRLMDRLRAISAVLARTADKISSTASEREDAKSMLARHKAFLSWLVHFASGQLRPTAAYQRHISALKILSIVIRSGVVENVDPRHFSKSALGDAKWPFQLSIKSHALQRLLCDLMLDPFDDVRHVASSVFPYIVSCREGAAHLTVDMRHTIAKAEDKMLSTGRADHADGVSHLFFLMSTISTEPDSVFTHLVDRLETMLDVAEHDLQRAVEKYPLHGLLNSITRCMDAPGIDAKLYQRRLVSCLHRIWQVVRPILCDDAPEGHVPDTIEDTSDVNTKSTLSFCWRALKEASILLDRVLSDLPDAMLSADLHNLCFEQLAELRHRGAFSTVAQTWGTCCTQAAIHTADTGLPTLDSWYNRVLAILKNRTTINTRRSAGLPSLLCGILIADERGGLLDRAFRALEEIARGPVDTGMRQESSLTQVHAMNCIKDILKNSKLGERSEAFLPAAMKLAADALQSQAWAVRNCGLMLFRGVIDRLLGTSHAQLEEGMDLPRSIVLEHRTRLFEVVLGLLSGSNENLAAGDLVSMEGVFPALQLLQRLQLPNNLLAEAKLKIERLLGSPAWHVRDKAARTYANLLERGEVHEIQRILQSQASSVNLRHGQLLCVRYIIARVSARISRANLRNRDEPSVADLITAALTSSTQALSSPDASMPVIRGAWLDISIECLLLWQISGQGGDISPLVRDRIASLGLTSLLTRSLDATGEKVYDDHVPRLAAARLWALSLLTGILTFEHPSSALLGLLCLRDSDAAAEFFEITCKHIYATAALSGLQREGLQAACDHILENASIPTKAKLHAQRFLLASVGGNDGDDGPAFSISEQCLSSSMDNRDDADNAVQLRLLFLESSLARHGMCPPLLQGLNDLVSGLKAAVDEHSHGLPFSREAAAYGLAKLPLKRFWSAIRLEVSIRDALSTVLYDLLQDDDEDIRLLATIATHKFLDDEFEVIPQLASHKLQPYLLSDTRNVLDRAFSDLSTSVSTSLAALLEPDTALFAEEKQNLYIDTAREVNFWSRCALQLSPDAIASTHVKQLSVWTLQGLEALVAEAGGDHDGPLGWTTDLDTFTLGLRVFYAAEFLLSLAQKRRQVYVRPSELRRVLGELVIVGERAEFNSIWMEEMERIYREAVWCRMRRLAVRLDAWQGEEP